jgi:1-pyrroline-5-carboxylate dehydrogenase
MSSAAIVTGNTVVMKPSEFTSVIGAVVAEIFEEAGLPDGVLNFLPGYGSDVGDYLVEDARTRFISFTGSMATGLRINERAARQIENQRWVKRVIAEMGGKDAMVIDDSADLDSAAADIVKSAYGYSGQKCSAASRAILHEDVYDEVLGKVVERAKMLKIGPPRREDGATVNVGPVISEPQFEKVSGFVDAGKRRGTGCSARTPATPRTATSSALPSSRSSRTPRWRARRSSAPSSPSSRPATSTKPSSSPTIPLRPHRRRLLQEPRPPREGSPRVQGGQRLLQPRHNRALVGVQPFGGFGMSGTDSKAGGPDYLPLHMLARTVVERF